MTITAPTKITIEVHPGAAGAGAEGASGAAFVRVIPDSPSAAQPVLAAEPRLEMPAPAAYDPGDCRCLDDEDCAADHANE